MALKLMIVSRDKAILDKYIEKIHASPFEFSKNPDIVITLGGDGTFLVAERDFPGVPKLLVRDSKICNKCDWDGLEPVLERLAISKYEVQEFNKLEARANGKVLLAANDIVIRNTYPTHAIRFIVKVDGKEVDDELIGDGIVVSTAFGADGYFYSITKERFQKGIGIAFNNVTRKRKPLMVEGGTIEIKITRGHGMLAADNNPKMVEVKEGDEIVINLSKEKARVVKLR